MYMYILLIDRMYVVCFLSNIKCHLKTHKFHKKSLPVQIINFNWKNDF